jgi:hypothetical protein
VLHCHDEAVKNSFVSLLNDVSTENVDDFIASINEAFKTPTPAAESNMSATATASAAKASTPITLDSLTRIVTAEYGKANVQISSILQKEDFVKLSSTDQVKQINVLIKANNALKAIITKISDAIKLYKPENEDSNSKLYIDAIEAITSAIYKVNVADSAPSSGAADAADAVRAAIEAVNKTNYSSDVGYKKQLDADVGKVEKATGSNLIKLLENLLFLVISKLKPMYTKALTFVDEATKAAAAAASKALDARVQTETFVKAEAAATSVNAPGAADSVAVLSADATDAAAAAVERATNITKDAVSAATIYNNFFKTITSMNKEYGLVKTACTEVTTSLTLTDSSSPINFSNVKSKLEALKVALEALKTKFDEKYNPDSEPGVFSLFDGGGSKTKSKSSSSHKSKSKSKNKTKNKTKKNHSHSDKRKIPKIKMN